MPGRAYSMIVLVLCINSSTCFIPTGPAPAPLYEHNHWNHTWDWHKVEHAWVGLRLVVRVVCGKEIVCFLLLFSGWMGTACCSTFFWLFLLKLYPPLFCWNFLLFFFICRKRVPPFGPICHRKACGPNPPVYNYSTVRPSD